MSVLHTRGARISYSRTGAGETVLLIQGVGAVGDAWTPQVEALRYRFNVITFDNRGIGASAITEGRLTIESMADDALAILDAEGVDRCHVVGHSMGGLIAMQLALTSPRRVKSLTLLSTFPDGKTGSRLTLSNVFTGIRTRVGTKAMRRRAFLSLVLSRAGMQRENLSRLTTQMTNLFGRDLADQPAIIVKQLRAMSRFDPTWRLRCLASVRTLVVTGAEDRIALPAYGRKLAAAIPGARYVELAKSGHAVPIESPALINRMLYEHMAVAKSRLAS